MIVGMASNPFTGTAMPYTIVEHNTCCVGNLWGVMEGANAVPEVTGHNLSLRSNLFWNSAPPTGAYGYMVVTSYTGAGVYPDPVVPGFADYNAAYNCATVPANTWAAPNNAGNGTLYNLPLTVTPGGHDVVGVNPAFMDATRNFQTWDAVAGRGRHGGQCPRTDLGRLDVDKAVTHSLHPGRVYPDSLGLAQLWARRIQSRN